MTDRSPRTLWETALGRLELQVTRPNFDTWLRPTVGLRIEDTTFVVGVPTDFAVEWLRSRMSPLVARIVSELLGAPMTVSFEVIGAQPVAGAPSPNGQGPQPPASASSLDPDPRLTFDSFTVVDSNRLAHRSARQLAAGESSYSLLVLYGPPGLGKSHLLHAIAHHAQRAGCRVLLLTGEELVERYGRAVRAGHPQHFREAYRQCDLFLLDDLQFLSSRRATQEQFFHIFNTLLSTGRRLALVADSSPQNLAGLSQHLRSRLQAGLSLELLLPPASERLDILRAKLASLRRTLPDSILHLIAEQPYHHIRELEGAMNRVIAFADLHASQLTLDDVRQALHPLTPPPSRPPTQAILRAVSDHFHLSPDQLSGPSRARDISYARHVTMYLLRHLGQCSLAEIGTALGNRDHSTILHGCRRIDREIASLPSTRSDVDHLRSTLDKTSA